MRCAHNVYLEQGLQILTHGMGINHRTVPAFSSE